ncbi:hypothetical protein BMETH_635_1 [methanotrophic bacterial endosymbiont of Bathymodiolus sp.]|nr:hypothetical protein BMETH_635_1 [methanotrophic bacterial endosymbiont of Bathymodiolus sp.]
MGTVKSSPYLSRISYSTSSSLRSFLMLFTALNKALSRLSKSPFQGSILDESSLKTLKPMSKFSISPLSALSCRIFSPARRMRSLPMSVMVLYPNFKASFPCGFSLSSCSGS